MDNIFTIGFTKKTAEKFFSLIKDNNISLVVDIRLNNTSQLAGFSKYPDIKYFLDAICKVDYIHEPFFAPEESTLSKYKKGKINWSEYTFEFLQTMEKRQIKSYILKHYSDKENICLLCSEVTPENCHRSLLSNIFCEIFGSTKVINL